MCRPEPLKEQVRIAFAQSIRVIWLVVIPFVRCVHPDEGSGADETRRVRSGWL